ncbi:Calcium-transporting ATPase 1 [Acaryochloris thomasi RCC1774]|uniref:Calcium-transporting ATPase 1 n=1 Tax=Acaryochloris thomasi RCC1774 TaxID=1764569 RepID=A0A2W1JPH1_9CYAN|nr:HAD-IC family P-type ATPase [Acaryochloris thomasi]PZD71141.1 Calcium-transporting ATPase 1 [Acaryochloris thomasi RCC1774]
MKSPRLSVPNLAPAPWHCQTTDAVLKHWQVNRNQGLSSEKVQQSLEQYGPNRQPDAQPRSRLSILVEQFQTLPVVLLSVAAVLSFLTGGHTDAIVIMVVVLINAVIGYTTESQSERIIQSLKDRTEYTAQVVRNGILIGINIQNVVPGDMLSLKPGSVVAADARLIETERLSIDESVLTGESLPVQKITDGLANAVAVLGDRNNMVYKGTLVTGGQGLAVVVATGTATEIGRIQMLVGTTLASPTPMEQQLDQVGNLLVYVSSGVCLVIFGLGLLRGYGLLQMLKTSIALAVAAVPEGLPAVATTTLALGILEMRRQKVLIRRLEAVEALGSMQSLCLDKTGTLTENTMSVVELFADNRTIQVSDGDWLNGDHPIQPLNSDDLQLLLKVLVLCNETDVNGSNEIESLAGSSTEKALVELAIRAGVDVSDLRKTLPRLVTQYRSCDRNYMATLHTAKKTDQQLIAVKGNPNEVLRLCQWRLEAGTQVVLSDADRQSIADANQKMAGQALRVLGIAYRLSTCESKGKTESLIAPNTIVWLGLVGMTDPIRQGIGGAIKTFHQAGVDTMMLTGDQHPTAYAVGQTLNLSQDQPLQILDANNLDESDLDLSDCAVHGFARISPTNKLQIVQALQQTGRVVAMTGDGINDAPALKAADIGIAMGNTGTDLAREVADVVLADDNLATLITAISRGRTIYSNIRKAIHFLLSTNLSEILVMLLATGAALGQPLNALQLLWLNLITDIFPGLALALEPPEAGVLNLPPRDPSESLLRAADLKRMLFEALIISISALATYSYAVNQYGIGPHATTLGFLSLTSAQLLHALSCRSSTLGIFSKESLPPNLYLASALVFSFSLQLLVLMIPGLRLLLNISSISGGDECLIVLSAVLPLFVNEATKGLFHQVLGDQQRTSEGTPPTSP